MESVTVTDLGLDSPTILYNYQACLDKQKRSGSQRVTAFWNIINVSKFGYVGNTLNFFHQTPMLSVVLFLLPKGGPLELHGHPGMVVLSKVLLGSLKAQVVSALGPIDSTDLRNESPEEDPGFSMLPLNERVLDFGAVPSVHESVFQYAQLKASHPSERSAVRRRMIVGSRIHRQVGDKFDVLELFNGVVRQSPSKCGERKFDQSEWDTITPSEKWPTTFVCTPCFGNLHRFEAESDFVLVLDVISPSYEIPKSRDCQYVVPTGLSSKGPNGWPQFEVSVSNEDLAGPKAYLEFIPKIPEKDD